MISFHEKLLRDIDYQIQQIEKNIYTPVNELTVEGFITPEPVPFARRRQGKPHTFIPGECWGQLWDCAWVNVRGVVPAQARGDAAVMLFDCGGEALVVDADGAPLSGLTNVDSTFDPSLGRAGKVVFPLAHVSEVDLWLELACNDLFGALHSGKLALAHIATCHHELRALYYDAGVLRDLLRCLDNASARFKRVLFCLSSALNGLTTYNDDAVATCRQALAVELAKKGGDPTVSVVGIGHAHMDLAWLWPIRETKRKGARTFATALDLLGRYPDYHFGASQPQLFQWMKEDYPQLYARIQRQVQQGRLEIQGDMWVEPDTNVPSGESLVRQFLYGRQFFQQEFGQVTRMLWLPDVFGYNANLPQIMKKSGIDYFMTQKLSWNEHNPFPHHTFIWHGIDGSSVLSHMLPEETYNSPASPGSIQRIETSYHEAGVCDQALMLFGIGDGGGGPGEEHLERLKRMKNLSGIAPVKQGYAIDFFRNIAKDCTHYPHYHGELYLEKHQGTLTTQARNKRFNRKLENALRELEFLASRQWFYGQKEYPADTLQEIWREVLLYQFHDILPGSSIRRVYDESVARYEILLAQVEQRIQASLAELHRQAGVRAGAFVIHNLSGFAREEWLQLADKSVRVAVPAFGYRIMNEVIADTVPEITAQPQRLENDLLRVEFNEQGHIDALVDKQVGRSLLQSGTVGNQLAVYEDIGGNCWDINITYRQRTPEYFQLVSATARQEGAAAVVEQCYRYGNSRLTQKISLLPDSKRLTFETHVDWHERDKMLRTSFAVNILSERVSCDIQFGKFSRSARINNVYDAAQFEICAHKWIDYSRTDYGVALLNESKYGHYAKDGVLDLNLLRSQTYPGTNADEGEHDFAYALFPHCGDEVVGEVNREAYLFNNPLRINIADGVQPQTAVELSAGFISCNSPHICLETVKKAEIQRALVLRVWEFDGGEATADIQIPAGVTRALLTNLMEEGEEEIAIANGHVTLTFAPFEIKTLLLMLP
ncbi:alpha-mannosidase [Superficieibacter electus]|nr:glycoside hydrolase family 38 C-terminal domain-containing protein [Superficieibacter electus]